MSRYQKLFLLVIALTIAAVVINFTMPMVRGIDIAGGARVVLQVDPKSPADWPDKPADRREKMASIRKTIQTRVMGIQGTGEPVVQTQDPDKKAARLIVELPGVKDTEKAVDRIRSTASLEFYYLRNVRSQKNPIAMWDMQPSTGPDKGYIFTGPRGETIDSLKQPNEVLAKVVGAPKVKPVLTGKDLMANAKSNLSHSNDIIIQIEFNREGAKIFADFTRDHVGEYLAVFYDGRLLTAPVVRSVIPDGKAEVSGFSSLTEARQTAEYLNSGALPVPLKIIGTDTVEASVGNDIVNKVLFAGLAGLLLVIVFMVAYYRLPGVVASVALVLYALFTFAFFKVVHATMSLGGMAALIISVGMAVDANILIFERLKEELRSGKTLRAAIDAGFNRAFTAIFDSNMCTAITCAILMWYGSPSVKSFAFTLLFGVLISMFTAITVTRTIMHLLVGAEWAQNPALYALGTSWFSRVGAKLDIVGKRVYFFILSAVLIVPGLIVLGTWGLNPGIEFMSGTSIRATFKSPVQREAVRNTVDGITPGSEVQLAEGQRVAFITTRLLPDNEKVFNTKMEQLRNDLNDKFGLATIDRETREPGFDSINSVGPTISEELTTNAIWAVVFASVGIVLYLTLRFAIGGAIGAGLKYGTCAVVALLHDAAFILGLFAIFGRVLRWEVDSLFVTAVLTVIGFSVHDTIVVFDRIRENLRHRQRGESFEQLCNRSILQTFSRSINTSLTVVIVLVMLIALGGPPLRHFYVAMLAGIIIGTYSSIFDAAPLVVVWEKLAERGKAPKKKAFEDKPILSKPMVSAIDQPAARDNAEQAAEASDEQASATEKKTSPAKQPSARIKKKRKRF